MIAGSALYAGRVVHARFKPRKHKLSYACYWLLVDLDTIDELDARLRFWSHNRFNLFALWDRDHGDGSRASLRAQANRHLADAGIDLTNGRIFLLTMPRILGYGFNPLSVYYCQRSDGTLAALIYEVHNTFGQRHSYVMPVEETTGDEISQSCRKSFYVSPFLEMDLSYAFKVLPPQDAVRVGITVASSEGLMLTASLHGERQPLTDANLAKIFLTHPLLTAKVVGAIHWEALRLWLKGIRLVPRPPAAENPVTITPSPARIEVPHE